MNKEKIIKDAEGTIITQGKSVVINTLGKIPKEDAGTGKNPVPCIYSVTYSGIDQDIDDARRDSSLSAIDKKLKGIKYNMFVRNMTMIGHPLKKDDQRNQIKYKIFDDYLNDLYKIKEQIIEQYDKKEDEYYNNIIKAETKENGEKEKEKLGRFRDVKNEIIKREAIKKFLESVTNQHEDYEPLISCVRYDFMNDRTLTALTAEEKHKIGEMTGELKILTFLSGEKKPLSIDLILKKELSRDKYIIFTELDKLTNNEAKIMWDKVKSTEYKDELDKTYVKKQLKLLGSEEITCPHCGKGFKLSEEKE